MMRTLDTRTLQSQLWLAQHNLSKCTDDAMRDAYKLYISDLATELLYRYQQSKQ